MGYKILVINPGAGSTKVALFEDEKLIAKKELRHSPDELNKYDTTIDQLPMRRAAVMDFLKEIGIDPNELDAVVGRGGAFKPLEGGVYTVDKDVIDDIMNGNVQADHPSNLGALIAYEIAEPLGIPAYFVDPVSVDEFHDLARPSGLPELPRRSLLHTLNSRYVARKAAEELGVRYEDINLVVAHLGTGISISAHQKGRIIDVNNANDGGPFSPQRAGSLPTTGLIKLAFSGKYTEKELLKKVTRNAGLVAYLGTDDIREVEKRAFKEGDLEAELIYSAMIYQIGKEIGAYAAALLGNVDLIVVTGGMAKSERLCQELLPYIEWIARVKFYPGEFEMEALAYGALRALSGQERPKKYPRS